MTIKRALISVSSKTDLVPFATFLHESGIKLLSTGGTARMLREAGLEVTDVSDYTGFPEIMDGRVKTLHPKVHGAILGKRAEATHRQAMEEHAIEPIDMLVINLYPFKETVASGADIDTCIENIDIGGPAMIRAAAKNHADVTIVTDPADYEAVMSEMKEAEGTTTPDTRRKLAAKAYSHTASYDAAISNWFAAILNDPFPERVTLSATRKQLLAYGENPHQQAAFYTVDACHPSLATATQHQGKALSYNNINDTDAAWELVSEFSKPTVAIIKHANPCGVASADSLQQAYLQAYACDTTSAFGGIIALNRPLDAATAEEITKLFVEVVIAPDAEEAAKEVLAKKQKLRLLTTGGMPDAGVADMVVKSVTSGFLVQSRDNLTCNDDTLKVVTKAQPDAQQLQDLKMALTVGKHVKSNSIVLVRDAATVGIGAGQMSRIDSTRIACRKAEDAGLSTKRAALASEAFFPFADNVEMAAEAGISAIIQPGGSIRDAEVIEAADKHGIAMVFTGIRHFRH